MFTLQILPLTLMFLAPFLPACDEQLENARMSWKLTVQCAHARKVEWDYLEDDDGNERYIVTIHRPKQPYAFGRWLLKATDGKQQK